MPSFLCMPFFACNRQVDSLDKRQCNLQTIPHEIERYGRTLEELLLDMNHIRDLPKSLFRLHKLRRLGLSDNDIHRLPAEIASLQNLMELNISRNDISDLPEDLKVCRQLLILDVSSNPIARLPDSITHVLSLTHLALNDTSLTKLPQDIGRLTALKSLEVRENHLRTLPPSITQLTHLLRLDLGQNELDELPAEIGALIYLQELYVDDNSLEMLPESILYCSNLEQLDVQSNRLMALPIEVGDLLNLADLTLSHNCLSALPNSIGRLKKLLILRVDDNSLTQLTPAIGSCTSLNELYLMQNLISELPSSIGNLSHLQNLNMDKNQLTHVPALIGDCSSLSLLSLRDNLIEELPLEIGKLSKLRVLDVSCNRLSHLPFTINVLFNLQALWLSENQSQAMLKLQQEVEPRTGIKVLTCYLLPQQSAALNDINNRMPNRSFVGGPKVHFGDVSPEGEGESSVLGANSFGNFERHDTPHPKPHLGAPKLNKKQVIDGHIIPRLEEHQPTTLALTKKISTEQPPLNDQQNRVGVNSSSTREPRSALKFKSYHDEPASDTASKERNVAFSLQKEGEEGKEGECRLKRINTPHYAKGYKLSTNQPTTIGTTPSSSSTNNTMNKQQQQPSSSLRQHNKGMLVQSAASCDTSKTMTTATPSSSSANAQVETKRVIVRREPNHGLGLSIAGGLESTPYVEGDTGLFISKLIPNAPAERCGLRVGDKVVEINGTPMTNQRHDVAVQCIQQKPDIVNLLVSRVLAVSKPTSNSNNNNNRTDASSPPGVKAKETPPPQPTKQENGAKANGSVRNVISTSIKLDENASPGFTLQLDETEEVSRSRVAMAASSSIVISAVETRDLVGGRLLAVGDQVLSINGINTTRMGLQEAIGLLKGRAGSEVYLVVAKAHPSEVKTQGKEGSAMGNNTPTKPFSPPPLTNHQAPSPLTTTKTVADLSFGDPCLDGVVEELQLSRDAKNSLGLSIVGGIDHCSHPFGTDNPGVFISKITSNSPAAASRHLRVGDRILTVNGRSVDKAKHNVAVEALKSSGQSLVISVKHEPQPKGLQEVVFLRRRNEPLGLSICGGINSPPANPVDPTDEGIFIEHVERGGCAEQCTNVRVGQRILEVNDDSLLGCTKEEAAQLLRRAPDTVRLLVCDGIRPAEEGVDKEKPLRAAVNASSSSLHSSSVADHFNSSGGAAVPNSLVSFDNAKPLATSSPIPPALPPKRSQNGDTVRPRPERDPKANESTRFSTTLPPNSIGKIPPPTAPKPKQAVPVINNNNNSNNHSTTITSFSTSKLGPHHEVSSPANQSSASLTSTEHPSKKSVENHPPSPITTFGSTQVHPSHTNPAAIISQRDAEQQKRREWRQARLASLDSESSRADELMNCVKEFSRLGNVSEEKTTTNSRLDEDSSLNGKNGNSATRIIPIQLAGASDIRFADEEK